MENNENEIIPEENTEEVVSVEDEITNTNEDNNISDETDISTTENNNILDSEAIENIINETLAKYNEENTVEDEIIIYSLDEEQFSSINDSLSNVNTNTTVILSQLILVNALLLTIFIYLFLHFMLERRKI